MSKFDRSSKILYFLSFTFIRFQLVRNFHFRSCNERGGLLNDKGDQCMISLPLKNISIYKIGFDAPATNNALFIVSLTGNVISLICLALLLITYVIHEKHNTVPGKSIMCLSLALIGTNISQILVSYLHDNSTICATLGILLHWFFLCAFLWMSALAYDYFITFHRIQLISSNAKVIRFRAYCLLAFALPTVAVMVCLALDIIPNKGITHYGANGKCFVVGFWTNLFAFVVPIAMLISVNIFLLCFTIRDIQVLKNSTRHVSARNRKETIMTLLAIKVAILVGAGWIMAFIDGFFSNIIVKYIYTVIVTYQGFFVYVAFGYFTLMVKLIARSIINTKKTSVRAPMKETQL